MCILLQNKIVKDSINALADLFKNRKPKNLQTDKGKEIARKYGRIFLKSHEVLCFSSESKPKAQKVERFSRTVKEKLWKCFTYNNTKHWIDVLPSFAVNYNKSYYRSIKMKPIEASKKRKGKQCVRKLVSRYRA